MREVLFDVTRLFVRGSRFSPTGIDRVVMAYARWLLGREDVALRPVLTVGGRLLGVHRATLARLIEGSEVFARSAASRAEGDASWAAIVAALSVGPREAPPLRAKSLARQIPARLRWQLGLAARSATQLRPAPIPAGAVYLNVSHTGLDQPRVLGRIANRGASPVVMVHDLIPIYFPEYCAPGAEARHARRMSEIITHARLVITNSATTAEELRDYTGKLGAPTPEIAVIPLGIEKAFSAPPVAPASAPYFVCVGTIEARKNLAFLLALWRRLAERMGEATPRLVMVGRRGWENESVIDHLQRSDAVIRLVHEVSDLQDCQLARLVAGAAALLSPSFAEGFDLPVIEALSLRTPVIASDIPVHRELAAGVTLIDPFDGAAWLTALEAAAQRAGRGPTFSAPSWEEHFATVADRFQRLALA